MQFTVADITVNIISPTKASTPEDDKRDFAEFLYKLAEMNMKDKG